MLPFVSVIIPVYNRASIVKESILSVINQDYPKCEIIVVDDGSTDCLENTIREIGSSLIRFYRLSHNHGQSYARNTGVHLSRGELIAFQDSDDIWSENRIYNQVERMQGYDFSFGKFERRGQVFPILPFDTVHLYQSILSDPLIGTPTLFCKKEALLKVGGFNERYRCFEDYDLSLRLSKRFKGVFINEILLFAKDYELHVESEENAIIALRVRCDLFKRYYKDICLYNLERKWICGLYGFQNYCDNDVFLFEMSKIESFINNNCNEQI